MNAQNLDSKEKCAREMSEDLNDCLTAPKTYWKILNRFLNNIKIPSRPPLINREIVLNFLERAEPFNKFFASQCSLVKNSSTLPPFKLRRDKVT